MSMPVLLSWYVSQDVLAGIPLTRHARTQDYNSIRVGRCSYDPLLVRPAVSAESYITIV